MVLDVVTITKTVFLLVSLRADGPSFSSASSSFFFWTLLLLLLLLVEVFCIIRYFLRLKHRVGSVEGEPSMSRDKISMLVTDLKMVTISHREYKQ